MGMCTMYLPVIQFEEGFHIGDEIRLQRLEQELLGKEVERPNVHALQVAKGVAEGDNEQERGVHLEAYNKSGKETFSCCSFLT